MQSASVKAYRPAFACAAPRLRARERLGIASALTRTPYEAATSAVASDEPLSKN